MSIDQIVLSPATYLTSSPGALKNDTTILPPSGSTPPPPDTEPPTAAINAPAQGATVGGRVNVSVSVADNVGVTSVDLLVDGDVVATDSSAPFSFAWNTTQVADGTHSLRLRAHDAAGNTGMSATVQVTVDSSSDPVQDVVLYASDASTVAGAWQVQPNASAAGGFAVAYPNANRAKLKSAQAAPSAAPSPPRPVPGPQARSRRQASQSLARAGDACARMRRSVGKLSRASASPRPNQRTSSNS